jgi:hypothetical protein
MLQPGMMFNTLVSAPFDSTSVQTAPSDKTTDHLQKCMDSVKELAKTIAYAMDNWHGRGLLECSDIHGLYAKVSANLEQLPSNVECTRCTRRTYKSALHNNTRSRASLLSSTCTCDANPEPAKRRRTSGTPQHVVATDEIKPTEGVAAAAGLSRLSSYMAHRRKSSAASHQDVFDTRRGDDGRICEGWDGEYVGRGRSDGGRGRGEFYRHELERLERKTRIEFEPEAKRRQHEEPTPLTRHGDHEAHAAPLKPDEVSAELEKKQKELEEDMLKPPVKFKDAVGRNFTFPWHLCKTWKGMESLIKSAFVQVDVIGAHVQEGHYDLMSPTGEIVLPQVWDAIVKPSWEVTMHMWPIPETPKKQKKKKEKKEAKPDDAFDNFIAQQFAQMSLNQVVDVPPAAPVEQPKKTKKEKEIKKAKRNSVPATAAAAVVAGPSTIPQGEMPAFSTREEWEHWMATGEPPEIVEDPVVEVPKRKERISVPIPEFNTREEYELWLIAEEQAMRDRQQQGNPDESFDTFIAQQFAQMGAGQSINALSALKPPMCKKAKRSSVSPAAAVVAGPSTIPQGEMPAFSTREEWEHWMATGEGPAAAVVDQVVVVPEAPPKPPKKPKKISGIAAWMAGAPAKSAKKRVEQAEQRQRQLANISHPQTQIQASSGDAGLDRLPSSEHLTFVTDQSQPPDVVVDTAVSRRRSSRVPRDVPQMDHEDGPSHCQFIDPSGGALGLDFDIDIAASYPSSDAVDWSADDETSDVDKHKSVSPDHGYNIDFDPPEFQHRTGSISPSDEDMLDPPSPASTDSLPRDDVGSGANLHDTESGLSPGQTPLANHDLFWSRDRVQSWLAVHDFSDVWQTAFDRLGVQGSQFLDLGRSISVQQESGFMIGILLPQVMRECVPAVTPTDPACLLLRDEAERLRELVQDLAPDVVVEERDLPDYTGSETSGESISLALEWLTSLRHDSSSKSLVDDKSRSPSPPPRRRENRAVPEPKTNSDVGSDEEVTEDVSAVQALLNRWLDSSASALLLKDDGPVT